MSSDPTPLFMNAFWIGLAALVAYFASRKGRRPALWFLYGALLWPVAMAHVLIAPGVAGAETGPESPAHRFLRVFAWTLVASVAAFGVGAILSALFWPEAKRPLLAFLAAPIGAFTALIAATAHEMRAARQ